MAVPASAAVSSPGLYGYYVSGGPYKTVTAGWHVPTPTCTSGTSFNSIWTGLDGITSASVEQVGIDFDCSGGKAQYYGWYDLYPAAPVTFSNTVKPGDSMSASVAFSGTSKFTITLADTTQDWNRTVTASLSGTQRSSAEVFVQDPGATVFTPVDFTGVTVDGAALGSLNPTKVTGGDNNLVVSPVTGSAFSVSWDVITHQATRP
jgi:hypothetical protein